MLAGQHQELHGINYDDVEQLDRASRDDSGPVPSPIHATARPGRETHSRIRPRDCDYGGKPSRRRLRVDRRAIKRAAGSQLLEGLRNTE